MTLSIQNVFVSFQAYEIPGIKIFRLEASFNYVNKGSVTKKLFKKTGVNPVKLKVALAKEAKRQKAHEKKMAVEHKVDETEYSVSVKLIS